VFGILEETGANSAPDIGFMKTPLPGDAVARDGQPGKQISCSLCRKTRWASATTCCFIYFESA